MYNMKDTAVTTGSGGALFLPWWIDWLPHMWQLGVSIMAATMLGLGVYSKYLEIQQRRRDLYDPLDHIESNAFSSQEKSEQN